jgi:hypothetical protein
MEIFMSVSKEKMDENFVEIEVSNYSKIRMIKETLTRMGIGNNSKKKLYQSCHLLERNDRYFIVHFKELFLLDNKPAYFAEGDLERRNKIAEILETWGLCKIVNKEEIKNSYADDNYEIDSESEIKVFIIGYRNKSDWELIKMYNDEEEE